MWSGFLKVGVRVRCSVASLAAKPMLSRVEALCIGTFALSCEALLNQRTMYFSDRRIGVVLRSRFLSATHFLRINDVMAWHTFPPKDRLNPPIHSSNASTSRYLSSHQSADETLCKNVDSDVLDTHQPCHSLKAIDIENQGAAYSCTPLTIGRNSISIQIDVALDQELSKGACRPKRVLCRKLVH